jgi:hypothetical protein
MPHYENISFLKAAAALICKMYKLVGCGLRVFNNQCMFMNKISIRLLLL